MHHRVEQQRPVQDENNNQILINQNNQPALISKPNVINQSNGRSIIVKQPNESSTKSINQLTKHLNRQPLCMQTYKHIFKAYRRPGDEKDELVINQDDEHNHIVIACRDQFFALSLTGDADSGPIASDGDAFVTYLYSKLIAIWEFCSRLDTVKENRKFKQESVGLYTTEMRRTWWQIRNNLIKSLYFLLFIFFCVCFFLESKTKGN